jgi:membrane protein DedA with SNARE-associated domain
MKSPLGLAVVVIAIIWAAVIIAVSMALGDVPQSSRVISILGGGAAASIILLGGMIARERKNS